MTQPTTAECIEWLDGWTNTGGFYVTHEDVAYAKSCRAKLLEHDQLTRWKAEGMQVMRDLDLQESGKEIGLPLGDNIAISILPYIIKMKAKLLAADEMAKVLMELDSCPSPIPVRDNSTTEINLHPARVIIRKTLTAWREAGGQ